MTPWPKPDQWVGVSTTTSPVRHIAEVAVNRASTTEAVASGRRAAGVRSAAVPTAIAAAKLSATTLTGVRVARAASRRSRDGADAPAGVLTRRRLDPLRVAGEPGRDDRNSGSRRRLVPPAAADERHPSRDRRGAASRSS